MFPAKKLKNSNLILFLENALLLLTVTDVSTTCAAVFHSFALVLLEILTQIILQSHKGTCTCSLHHRNHIDTNEKF